MTKDTYSYFRKVARLEGISFLVLLFIAMPLKYIWDMPLPVKYVGWVHGALFIWFLAVLVSISFRKDWAYARIIWAFGASLIPFGPFFLEKKFLKDD